MSEGVFGPLNFNERTGVSIQEQLYPSSFALLCLFCDKSFNLYSEKQEYLTHLYLEHRLIIGDEDEVAIFHDYLKHWRTIFAGDDSKIGNFCTTILMDQLVISTFSHMSYQEIKKDGLTFLFLFSSPVVNHQKMKNIICFVM